MGVYTCPVGLKHTSSPVPSVGKAYFLTGGLWGGWVSGWVGDTAQACSFSAADTLEDYSIFVTHASGSRGQPGLPEGLCPKAKGLETSRYRKLPVFNSDRILCLFSYPILSRIRILEGEG